MAPTQLRLCAAGRFGESAEWCHADDRRRNCQGHGGVHHGAATFVEGAYHSLSGAAVSAGVSGLRTLAAHTRSRQRRPMVPVHVRWTRFLLRKIDHPQTCDIDSVAPVWIVQLSAYICHRCEVFSASQNFKFPSQIHPPPKIQIT